MKNINEILASLGDGTINLNLNISVSEDRNTIIVKEPNINLIIQQLKEKVDEKHFVENDIDLDSELVKLKIRNVIKQYIDNYMKHFNKDNIVELLELENEMK